MIGPTESRPAPFLTRFTGEVCMGDLQFAVFYGLLAATGLSSVGMLFVFAIELWQYESGSKTQP